MARDYHMFFPPIRASRPELIERVEPLLEGVGMSFSGDCMELAWSADANAFLPTYRTREFGSASTAIAGTKEWEGVVLEFDAPLGDRSVFLWESETGQGTSFGFEDPSGHFLMHTEDPNRWLAFEDHVLDLAIALQASFAILVPNPPYATWTQNGTLRFLRELPSGPRESRPPLVVLSDGIEIESATRDRLSRFYVKRESEGFAICRELHHGLGSDE